MTDRLDIQRHLHLPSNNLGNHCNPGRVGPSNTHKNGLFTTKPDPVITTSNEEVNTGDKSVGNSQSINRRVDDLYSLDEKIKNASSESEKMRYLVERRFKAAELLTVIETENQKRSHKISNDNVSDDAASASATRKGLEHVCFILEGETNEMESDTAYAESRPEQTSEKQIEAISERKTFLLETAYRAKKIAQSLAARNPKLFSNLQQYIDRTSRLIERLKLFSAKFEEFKRKYFDKKNEGLEDSYQNELLKNSDLRNKKILSDVFIENLLEKDKTEKEEEREKIDKKSEAKKQKEKEDDLLFESLLQKNKGKYQLSPDG